MIVKKRLLIVAVLVLTCSFIGTQTIQSYSDTELYQNGNAAYAGSPPANCVMAAKFYFAYLLRNPTPENQRVLVPAIEYCEQNTAPKLKPAGSKGDDPHGIATPQALPPKPVVNLTVSSTLAKLESTATFEPPQSGKQLRLPRCDIYARIAVAQNGANTANACGFTGVRWDSIYDNHYTWCSAVSSQQARAETVLRQNMLNQCAP